MSIGCKRKRKDDELKNDLRKQNNSIFGIGEKREQIESQRER